MKTGVIVAIGVLSAGLVISGTVWYFRSKRPKTSTSDSTNDEKNNEDIPDTTKTVSSSSTQYSSSPTQPKQQVQTNTSTTATSGNILSNLMKKLGSGARLKDNQVFAPFNSNKNIAVFYSNGRFSVFKIGEEKKGYLIKGSFKNDGLSLLPDNGKQISSGSVWTNLNMLPIKK